MANRRNSRSSLHYDPQHNLLVVVAGAGKTVHLLAPCATAHLRPMPVWGESANHSPVDIVSLQQDSNPFPPDLAVLRAHLNVRHFFRHPYLLCSKRGFSS